MKQQHKIACIIIALLGMLLWLQHAPRQSLLERCCGIVTYPVLVMSNAIASTIQYYTTQRTNYEQLVAQLTRLRNAHDLLLEEFIKTQGSLHHCEMSKELINFQKRYNFNDALVAKILSRTITPQEHTCFINKGAREGIKPNMIAFYKLQIVGKISEVYDFYSKVILITDKRCKIAAFTNNTHVRGIVSGTNTPQLCRLDYVDHLATLEQDDLVFSSGEGMVFPEGFCLGKIAEYHLEPQALHYMISLEPLVDFADLQYCLLANQAHINLF